MDDFLKCSGTEFLIEDDRMIRRQVYRYDAVLSENQKTAILSTCPGAEFSVRAVWDGSEMRFFSEVVAALDADFIAS